MQFRQNTEPTVWVLGRANVDFYVHNPEDSLQDSGMFEKSVGGSAANIAVGLAKLGRSVELLSKVSDDSFGHFVLSFLKQANVGTRFVRKDASGSLTSLAFAERRKENSRVLFYRNRASDLMISLPDVPISEIEQGSVLVVTGTGLSASPSREATLFAMEAAGNAGTKVVFDLDWRASAWSSMEEAGLVFRMAAALSHIIIGTREEMDVLIAPGSGTGAKTGRITDSAAVSDKYIAERFLGNTTEMIVIKNGIKGSAAYGPGGNFWTAGIFPVEVKKNYGAGDAFAAAFLHGLLDSRAPDEAMRWGAAAAAIVVSGSGCAASSPSGLELQKFLLESKEV